MCEEALFNGYFRAQNNHILGLFNEKQQKLHFTYFE